MKGKQQCPGRRCTGYYVGRQVDCDPAAARSLVRDLGCLGFWEGEGGSNVIKRNSAEWLCQDGYSSAALHTIATDVRRFRYAWPCFYVIHFL